jgi:biopolymer transport protein ExbD
MMRIRARRKPEEPEIIIIPMIDTMMFLLMFFIVASLAMVVQSGLPVHLPKASTGEKHSMQSLTLTVSATGDIHLNTKPIALADETSQLKALGVTEDTSVILNADERVQNGIVISVMDNARKAGVQHFMFATKS